MIIGCQGERLPVDTELTFGDSISVAADGTAEKTILLHVAPVMVVPQGNLADQPTDVWDADGSERRPKIAQAYAHAVLIGQRVELDGARSEVAIMTSDVKAGAGLATVSEDESSRERQRSEEVRIFKQTHGFKMLHPGRLAKPTKNPPKAAGCSLLVGKIILPSQRTGGPSRRLWCRG